MRTAPRVAWSLGHTIIQHHERYDGGGYPAGLAGDEICYGARIVAVPDAYEVMTAPRPYKDVMSARAAREELTEHAGRQFDPAIVRAFLNLSTRRLLWIAGPAAWLAQIRCCPGLRGSTLPPRRSGLRWRWGWRSARASRAGPSPCSRWRPPGTRSRPRRTTSRAGVPPLTRPSCCRLPTSCGSARHRHGQEHRRGQGEGHADRRDPPATATASTAGTGAARGTASSGAGPAAGGAGAVTDPGTDAATAHRARTLAPASAYRCRRGQRRDRNRQQRDDPVLANDAGSLDGATISVVGQPKHGTAAATGTSVLYTAQSGWAGAVQFLYEVCTPLGCSTASVSVTVER